jgi:branched-chain amino acid transport system substrate-binding protein
MRTKKPGFIVLLSTILALSGCATGAPSNGKNSDAATNSDSQKAALNSSNTDSNKMAGKPVKLGHLAAMSGRIATYGLAQKIAVDMAVDEINKTGGINGSPLLLISEDDAGDPQQAVTQYRKLVNENIVGVLGPQSGGAWETVGPLANQSKVPTLNATALKPGITKLPWAMRIHPSDDKMIPDGVKAFKIYYPIIKKVVVVGDIKEASGAAGLEEFKKAAALEGLAVLDTVGYQSGTTDFSPIVTKIKGYKPDAILISSFLGEAMGVAKEMERQGIDIPVLGSALIYAGGFPTSAGTAGKNWHTIGFTTNEATAGDEKQANFIKEYLKRSQTITSLQQPANIANNSLAYDAVMMLADILRKEKINGDTPVDEARKKLQENFVKIKDFKGLNQFSMLPSGDGYIASRLLKLDVDKKLWVELK